MPSRDAWFSVDERQLRALNRALRQEEDGKAIRRDLMKGMREVLKPAQMRARAAVRSMPVRGVRHAGPGLRSVVARRVGTEVRASGRRAGARIKAKKTPNVRGFANAPRALNARRGWRHRGIGGTTWHQQIGKPGWFDDSVKPAKSEGKRAAQAVLKTTARRVAGKVR